MQKRVLHKQTQTARITSYINCSGDAIPFRHFSMDSSIPVLMNLHCLDGDEHLAYGEMHDATWDPAEDDGTGLD